MDKVKKLPDMLKQLEELDNERRNHKRESENHYRNYNQSISAESNCKIKLDKLWKEIESFVLEKKPS